MKKIFWALVIPTLMFSISLKANASNEYINMKGVKIDSKLYHKLELVGYSIDEIEQLEYNKVQKVMLMDIIDIKYQENYSFSSKKETFDMINEQNVSEKTSDISGTDSDGDKQLCTYITTYKENSDFKVFVRQKVVWNNVPKKRYSDILTISYLDNMSLLTTNGNADVSMSLSYDLTKYSKVGWKHKEPKYKIKTTVTKEALNYTGMNHDVYNHVLGKYFAFKFDLPKDTSTDGSSSRYYMVYKNTYSNFKVVMESNFITNFSDLSGTSFQSHYIHQTGSGKIDWGKISFTSTAPFLTYQTSFWINDPTFDKPLFNDFCIRFSIIQGEKNEKK